MKKKFAKRFLSWVMAAAMVISMLPLSAMAAEPGDVVAQIGDQTYATLGQAIDAAIDTANAGANNVEITVLQSCDLDKSITVPRDKTFTLKAAADADVTITDTGRFGMTLDGSFTMENITFVTNGRIALNGKDGVPSGRIITFSNVTLKMDGGNYVFNDDPYYCAAIFADTPANFVFADCDVEIKDYYVKGKKGGAAIRWNGKNGDTGYGVSMINGTKFTSSGCYSGFVGTLDLLVEDSTLNVLNHSGNGSNGTNYTIVNSTVNFSGNGSHGISAGDLIIKENSKVTSENNGFYGVYASADFLVDSTSKLIVTKNSAGGDFAGLKLVSTANGYVEAGAIVTITDNYCSGLSNNGKCVFEEGAKLTITGNVNDKGSTSNGGGIYNSGASANLTLPSDAVIYNNHANTAGDDIFNTGTITFGKVGSDWVLNDCEHMIDGWYDDAANARWEAHAENEENNHIVAYNDTTITGLTALKAAHGKNAVDKVSYPGLDKQVMDNDDKSWKDDSVGAAAGETINFKLTSNVPEDLTNYLKPATVKPPQIATMANSELNSGHYILTFHDVMDKNLENPDNFKVILDRDGTERDVDLTYTLTKADDDDLTDGCTFEIELDLAALHEAGVITDKDIANTTPIVVTYTATLKEDVVTGTYPNTAKVTYEGGYTEEDTVNVKTYAIKIFKYDQADESKGLSGAEFELYQKDAEGKPINVIKLTSGNDGYITKGGLDDGQYYLKETKAPDGYVKSDTEMPITIDTNTSTDAPISVNFANSLIPHTGGMGTTLFSIVGGALIATAGVVFFVSRRKKSRTA